MLMMKEVHAEARKRGERREIQERRTAFTVERCQAPLRVPEELNSLFPMTLTGNWALCSIRLN